MKYNFERKSFVCLFPWLSDSAAIKCTGQICDTIAVKYNLNSYIVTYNNEEYKRFQKYCPHTKLIFLKGKLKYGGWRVFRDLLWFTLLYSRKTDILYLYHFPDDNIVIPFIGNLYKFINRKGILYTRLEADVATLPPSFPEISQKGIINRIKNYILRTFYSNLDLLGVIDNSAFDLSKRLKLWQIVGDKSCVQLNGYRFYDQFPIKKFVEKNNTIVLAGRLNSFQKGLDVFLDALKWVDLKDWKVILMGEIGKDQIDQIERIEKEHPFINGNIRTLGHISDVSEYLHTLNDAKIFCLPSRFDGIPLVIPDAMSQGCVIIGSDLFGIKEIATNIGECGFYFPNGNSDQLAILLNKVISEDINLETISIKSKARAEKIFHWDSIVEGLPIARLLD